MTNIETAGQSHGLLANSIVKFVGDCLGNTQRNHRACADLAQKEPSWRLLFWPACQQGLAHLICLYSKDSLRCEALTRVTSGLRGARAPGHFLFALGVAADAHQMSKAIGRSVKSGTVRPAAAQATRSLTTWGAVWAGAELFGTGGALLGLETGPGAVVTSGVGALMGGFVGLFASEWLARRIDMSN